MRLVFLAALSNTPPAPTNPQATTQTNADPLKGVSEKGVQVTARSTKNYELDRAVRHTKGAMGTITKIGVGVLINERPIASRCQRLRKNADGSTPTSVPYTPEEIERLNQLVKGAVGFNNDRGDVVTVVGTKFEPQYDPTVIPWWRDENYQVMVNAGVVGGIFLLILLTVVRPMVRRLLALLRSTPKPWLRQLPMQPPLKPRWRLMWPPLRMQQPKPLRPLPRKHMTARCCVFLKKPCVLLKSQPAKPKKPPTLLSKPVWLPKLKPLLKPWPLKKPVNVKKPCCCNKREAALVGRANGSST